MSENGCGNFLTQEERSDWPKGPASVQNDVGVAVLSPADQIALRKKQGWRKIRNRQLPDAGFRIIKTQIVDNRDGETCDVNIVPPQMNIAVEQAATEAETIQQEADWKANMIEQLCKSQQVKLLVALHNSHLDKPISDEDILAEAEKIIG
jgi:hypothetical protein